MSETIQIIMRLHVQLLSSIMLAHVITKFVIIMVISVFVALNAFKKKFFFNKRHSWVSWDEMLLTTKQRWMQKNVKTNKQVSAIMPPPQPQVFHSTTASMTTNYYWHNSAAYHVSPEIATFGVVRWSIDVHRSLKWTTMTYRLSCPPFNPLNVHTHA